MWGFHWDNKKNRDKNLQKNSPWLWQELATFSKQIFLDRAIWFYRPRNGNNGLHELHPKHLDRYSLPSYSNRKLQLLSFQFFIDFPNYYSVASSHHGASNLLVCIREKRTEEKKKEESQVLFYHSESHCVYNVYFYFHYEPQWIS